MSAIPHTRSAAIGIAVAILLVLAQLAGPATPAGAAGEQLLVSTSADRSAPVPADGASLSGNAYVFVTVPDPSKVVRVAFTIDGNTSTRTTDDTAPYDLAGTAADGSALALDVSGLGVGEHRIEAKVRNRNSRVHLGSTFTVTNGSGTYVRPDDQPAGNPVLQPVTLGLHVTSAELSTWRSRATSGPYRITGDVSANSPGDWNRIVGYKDRFLTDPSTVLWDGPTANNGGGCVQGGAGGSPASDLRYVPPVLAPAQLRDAAFYAMVLPGAADAQAAATTARDVLLAQIDRADTVFADRSRWCLNGAAPGDTNPVFNIANWLTKLLYAYDYLTVYEQEQGQAVFTAAQRTAFETWIGAAATWVADGVDRKLDDLFVDRDAGDYTLTSIGRSTSTGDRITYYDGPVAQTVHRRYNNRNARSARLVTLAGLLTGDQAHLDHGRQYVREALMFGYFPEGAVSDFERWTDDDPTKGWKYGTEFAGALLTMADHLARAGDTSLYDFTTTDGALGSEGVHRSGKPKSLATLVADLMSYVDGTTVRYGTAQAARNGVTAYRIDSINELGNEELINDLQIMMGNRHYRDGYVEGVYTRTAPGAPPYPSQPRSGQGDPEGGEAGIYPGTLFMFHIP